MLSWYDLLLQTPDMQYEEVRRLLASGSYLQLPYAIATLERLALNNHAPSLNLLGWCYEKGRGVIRNESRAFDYYLDAATVGGVSVADFKVAICLREGRGVDKDEKEAVEFFRSAAEQGDLMAMFELFECYKEGKGIAKDEKEADKWLKKVTEAIRWEATDSHNLLLSNPYRSDRLLYQLACYFVRHGDDQQKRFGFDLLSSLAATDHAGEAMLTLAWCYKMGSGVANDNRKAFECYCKAAARGLKDAHFHLARCFADGLGTHKDEKHAATWFQKAAEQGDVKAMVELSDCYAHGKGVEKDEEMAVRWLNKAKAEGYQPAIATDIVPAPPAGPVPDAASANAVHVPASSAGRKG